MKLSVCCVTVYVSVANKDSSDERYVSSEKHRKIVQSSSSTAAVSSYFVNKLSSKVSSAEGVLAFHTIKHHHSFKSMICTCSLNRKIFEGTETAKNISYASTKAEAIIRNVIAPHATDIVVATLGRISCFGFAINTSNHGSMKIFLVLIQNFDWKEGGTKTKALENEQTGFVLNTVEKYGLSSNCVAYSGDNANVNLVRHCRGWLPISYRISQGIVTQLLSVINYCYRTAKLVSHFLSQTQPPNLINKFFEDEFSVIYVWFLHSLMSAFDYKRQAIEKERNCFWRFRRKGGVVKDTAGRAPSAEVEDGSAPRLAAHSTWRGRPIAIQSPRLHLYNIKSVVTPPVSRTRLHQPSLLARPFKHATCKWCQRGREDDELRKECTENDIRNRRQIRHYTFFLRTNG
ncbi:hypothetical protein PR048_018017 [Dryococelus australis]|uniref:Uncharacterized protein n=1 Tax=Dryococelus australis TaxID=614101 RepID=A0ABQ9HB46_9NEOP|nr:hypothetical protein PR048_018017 [Dryococelus australis]